MNNTTNLLSDLMDAQQTMDECVCTLDLLLSSAEENVEAMHIYSGMNSAADAVSALREQIDMFLPVIRLVAARLHAGHEAVTNALEN